MDLANEYKILLTAVKEAGSAILSVQKAGFTIEKKVNNDILTEADVLADRLLKNHLCTAFPSYGWLSEETTDDKTRLQSDRVWIVDPIDGTREFAQSIPEYAISVALIEKGQPILAVVFNPASNELFSAVLGEGAYLNGQQIYCASHASQGQYILLASRSEYRRGEWTQFEKHNTVRVIGSIAYKLALVAAGIGDATFSLGPKNEWDIAAGTLLITEAGGLIRDKFKKPISFNQENVLVPGIIGASAPCFEYLSQIL